MVKTNGIKIKEQVIFLYITINNSQDKTSHFFFLITTHVTKKINDIKVSTHLNIF